jgi:hypothetical protein
MAQFPSYVEHRGLYNVNPGEADEDYDPAKDRNTYVRLADSLPFLHYDEFQKVTALARAALERHGRFPGLEDDVQARRYYWFAAGSGELLDRTLRVEIANLRILTPAFIERLQEDVLAEHPLWRVAICGEVPETVVMVYPEAVRLAGVPESVDWRPALADVVRREFQLREPREGPHRRQVAYVRPKLAIALPQLDEKLPFRVLGLFDNYRGDNNEWNLWIVHRGPGYDTISVEMPKETGVGTHYPIAADGTFGECYRSDDADRWLASWVLPLDFGWKVLLQEIGELADDPPGREWPIELDPACLVRDADLAAQERASGFQPP